MLFGLHSSGPPASPGKCAPLDLDSILVVFCPCLLLGQPWCRRRLCMLCLLLWENPCHTSPRDFDPQLQQEFTDSNSGGVVS